MVRKGVDEVRDRLARHYRRVWATELSRGAAGTDVWPFRVFLGRPSRAELEREFADIEGELSEVERWALGHGLSCEHERRLVGSAAHSLPTHVCATSLDELAQATGMQGHLAQVKRRLGRLVRDFPKVGADTLSSLLKACDPEVMGETDFDLLCRAALWFSSHDARGMTPREVPLEGFHAKWLDAHGRRALICQLARLDDLCLRERPHLVRFHYLDPEHLAAGGRAHDTLLEGDRNGPAYEPRVVIICENRDSALWFCELEGGICVLGDGMAGVSRFVDVAWVARCRHLFYWGDIDASGFEILAKYRDRGLEVESMLMDKKTYTRYWRFGTDVDARGRRLKGKDALALGGLTTEENELYLALCSPDHRGPRRIEQERIPLDVARAELRCRILRREGRSG